MRCCYYCKGIIITLFSLFATTRSNNIKFFIYVPHVESTELRKNKSQWKEQQVRMEERAKNIEEVQDDFLFDFFVQQTILALALNALKDVRPFVSHTALLLLPLIAIKLCSYVMSPLSRLVGGRLSSKKKFIEKVFIGLTNFLKKKFTINSINNFTQKLPHLPSQCPSLKHNSQNISE